MNENVKKIFNLSNLFVLYIILQPIIDIVTSLCVKNNTNNLSLGIFIRTLFMFIIIFLAIINSDKKYRKLLLFYYGLLAIYFISFLCYWYNSFGLNSIFTQIKGLIKAFYLPVILVSLIPLFNKNIFKLKNKTLIYSLIGYCGSIFIFKLLNIAHLTYPLSNGAGTMGLFYAANEIGVIITILAAFLAIDLLKEKLNIINLIALFLYIYSCLELGTKLPFISLAILIFVSICVSIIKLLNKKTKNRGIVNLISLFGLIVIILLFLPKSSIGINISNVYGINFSDIYCISIFNKSNINSNKNTTENTNIIQAPIITSQQLTTAVVSNRNLYLTSNVNKYKNVPVIEKVLGVGYLEKTKDNNVQPLKLIEMDCFDIFICHGILGAILYCIPLFIILIGMFCIMIKNIKKLKYYLLDDFFVFLICAVFTTFLESFVAGHALTAPAVGLFIAICLILMKNRCLEIRGE